MNLNPMGLGPLLPNYEQPDEDVTVPTPGSAAGYKGNPLDLESSEGYIQPTVAPAPSPELPPTKNANVLGLTWPLPSSPEPLDIKSADAEIAVGLRGNPLDLGSVLPPYEQPQAPPPPAPTLPVVANKNPMSIEGEWRGNYFQPDDFNPPPVPEAAGLIFASEVPAATDSGFTLAHAPNPPSSLSLYLNGLFQTQDADYTLAGTVGTWIVPGTAGALFAKYRY